MIANVSGNSVVLFIFLTVFSCKKNNTSTGTPTAVDTTTVPEQITLFRKYNGNPVFDIGNLVPVWRSIHAANVSILAPAETGDNKWRLFLRGSGNNADGYHDNIGTFEQAAATFNPYGAWAEQAANPNLTHGVAGTCDEQHVLDAAAVTGPGTAIFLYYMSRDAANRAGICVATSTNGGASFTKFYDNPLKQDVGPNNAVFYNNRYYLYYGDAKWNGTGFDEPLQIWLSVSPSATAMSDTPTYALKTGGYGAFDSYSVNGAKIFKVSGDARWFMLYQCSTKNFDYPERFHCAYSTDLVNWTKVKNETPLLTRGKAGTFDQGAIWTGSVIEHADSLYIYYEGWGSFTNDAAKRDHPYYAGGNSRVGVAACATADFVAWINE